MPFWYKRRPWRRRRYTYRRRFRRPFRRRFYRRRWVRNFKRKLSKLTIKEWQPVKIRKLRIKGFYPCFLTTHERVTNNLTQWIDSIAPEHFPGGGGFAIIQFTLSALYELFVKGQNWWTTTNCNLPLIRYNGVKLKFYKAEKYDYAVQIIRCYPMKSTDIMYMSTQPSIIMQNRKSILIPCRQNSNSKKPYKKVFVKPPAQMQTHWYFQQHLANTPLLIILISAASFDRYYTSAQSKSTTIGFNSLNSTTFQFHNFKKPGTQGYKPQEKLYFWGLKNGSSVPPENTPMKKLVYLANTLPLTQGETIDQQSSAYETYFTNINRWGNIFDPLWLVGDGPLFSTNKTLSELKEQYNTIKDKAIKDTTFFTRRTIPNIVKCRYNPLKDKGKGNKIYMVSITSDFNTWQPPKNPKLIRENLPLWLLCWGWYDWHKKLQEIHLIDNEYLTVIESPYIEPHLNFYIPLDSNFTNEEGPTSPYQDYLTDGDEKNFHPKNAFQLKSINEIGSCGPGVIKLQPDHSAEAHFEYNFHFKVGGCPAPMDNICDPANQAIYPIPDTKSSTTSLQSPESSIYTYLYDFDERRGLLTKKATDRIQKDYSTEQTPFPFTGTALDLPTSPKTIQTSDEETSEEETKEDLFHQLKLLRKQQRKLKLNIMSLLQSLK
nr:MAG: ORF1 [TTV-like mini virus]